MTRKAFLKKYALRFGVTLFAVGMIVYVLAHAIGSSSFSLITTPLHTVTDRTTLSGEAFLFRDEQLLTAPEGLVNDLAGSGEKVAKGVELVSVTAFSGSAEALAEAQTELDRINRELSVLSGSLLPAGTTLAKAETYRQSAAAEYLSIRGAVRAGRWSTVTSVSDAFRADLNRRSSLMGGDEAAIRSSIAFLEQTKKELLTGNPTVLTADRPGIYYDRSALDGRETLFPLSGLEALTPSGLDRLRSAVPEELPEGQAVGKLVYGYSWYLAVTLDAGSASSFESGTRYKVAFPENNGKVLTLLLLSLTEEDGRVLAVFRSDEEPAGFLWFRSQKIELTVEKVTGLYIPERAVYTENGVKGVYIFENSIAHFRPIEILAEGDGYCLAAAGKDKNSLAQNDILILSGKNLYDGKVYS